METINLCDLIGGWLVAIPFVESVKNSFYEILPFLPRKCPFSPGKYYGYNMSIPEQAIRKDWKEISPIFMPNGVYRATLKFFSDDDLEGATVRFSIELYESSNAENIMR